MLEILYKRKPVGIDINLLILYKLYIKFYSAK